MLNSLDNTWLPRLIPAMVTPEIHILTESLRYARDTIYLFYRGTDGWYSKLRL